MFSGKIYFHKVYKFCEGDKKSCTNLISNVKTLRRIAPNFCGLLKTWTLVNNYTCIKDEAPHANSTYFKGLNNFAKLLLESSKPNCHNTLLPSLVESRWLCYRVYGQKNMTNTIQWSALFTVTSQAYRI